MNSQDFVLMAASLDALATMADASVAEARKAQEECKIAKLRLKGIQECNLALEKDVVAGKEALEAKLESQSQAHRELLENAHAKLAEVERLVASERARVAELEKALDRARAESERLREDDVARHEKKMEELHAKHANQLEEFHKTEDIRLREAWDEGWLQGVASFVTSGENQEALLATASHGYKEGFYACVEQLQISKQMPEGFDVSFLNIYGDALDCLDGEDNEDGPKGKLPSEAAIRTHLFKEAFLFRKNFITALEPLFGKPVEVDPVFFRKATFIASVGLLTFLVHFSIPLQFPKYQPGLLLQSAQHFDKHGVPVKSGNMTEYPWSPIWEQSEMADHIFNFLAYKCFYFNKNCFALFGSDVFTTI